MSFTHSCNEFRQLCLQIHEDWNAHGRDWTKPGFRAVALHRFGVWHFFLPWGLRFLGFRLYRMLNRYVRNHYGIELDYSARLGRRFVIGHQGGIVIHPNAEFGNDCTIRQNVTIGATRSDRFHEAPRLGNSVEVGAGAVIIGDVHIGDRARVGPNAVVMMDIPAGAMVMAPPPRVVGGQRSTVQKEPNGSFCAATEETR